MRVLITGISGMAGSHLAENLLEKRKYEVHGTVRWRSSREYIAGIENKIHLHECELQDPHSVMNLLDMIRPERIFHLASQSSVAASWNSPRETLVNNITAQLNIFEAMRRLCPSSSRILISGSSEEYGLVEGNELPVTETNQLRPLSPYGVSKVAQDTLAYQYYKSYGLNIVRTRSFNQTGPRRDSAFVISNFAKQIAEIENNLREPVIYVGNITAKRDFTDIRDVVNAYVLALEQCDKGSVYNIGSGQVYSIKKILDLLLGMTKQMIQIKEDPERMRPSDIPILYCDCSKFKKKTGWMPQIPFTKTLADLLDYWREKLGATSMRTRNEEVQEKIWKRVKA